MTENKIIRSTNAILSKQDAYSNCMSLHVCPSDLFLIWIAVYSNYLGKKLSLWLSACIFFIVVPLL